MAISGKRVRKTEKDNEKERERDREKETDLCIHVYYLVCKHRIHNNEARNLNCGVSC